MNDDEMKNQLTSLKEFKLNECTWDRKKLEEEKLANSLMIANKEILDYSFEILNNCFSVWFRSNEGTFEIELSSLDRLLRFHFYIWRKR